MKIYTFFFIAITFFARGNLSAQNSAGWKFKDSNAADTTVVHINSTYLLLGTLNDYAGRKWGAKQGLFDRYYPYEKPLMKFVDSLAKRDFKVSLTEKDGCYFNDTLSEKMNSFYKGSDLIDSLLYINKQNTLSFLLGVYYRSGSKISNEIYKIQLTNSPKHRECYEILKQLGCDDIYFKRLNNIPTIYIIYFKATLPIIKYFDTIEREKEKLAGSFLASSRKNISMADYKKQLEEYYNDEYRMIKGLFGSKK